MTENVLNYTDFYKTDHRSQYPKDTTLIYSNYTPRGSRIEGVDKVVVFGIQYFIKEYLINRFNKYFFELPKEQVVTAYKRRLDTSLGPDAVKLDHIEKLHDLGYLPVRIKALPEGSLADIKIPILTIVNTHSEFAWLTNFLETILANVIWMPVTSATTAYQYRKEFDRHMELTDGPKEFVQWMGHDFSMRGMAGVEAAAMSGAGHLLSFTGTDTIPAIDFLEEYYGADATKELIGGSVPATEHSVMSMNGVENEYKLFKRLITEVYPKGIVSIVSDTYDFWKVLEDFIPSLIYSIHDRNGRVVIRPDSGDPVEIICGMDKSNSNRDFLDLCEHLNRANESHTEVRVDINEYLEIFPIHKPSFVKWSDKYYKITYKKIENSTIYPIDLYQVDKVTPIPIYKVNGAYHSISSYGYENFTNKSFKKPMDQIGLIYGDAITLNRQKEILRRLEDKGLCASNLVLGIGSYTYQYVTRDTFGFAMKATYGELCSNPKADLCTVETRNIYKDPKTDDGLKKSAKGLLAVHKDANNKLFLKEECTWEEEQQGLLEVVFENGKLKKDQSLQEIRERLGTFPPLVKLEAKEDKPLPKAKPKSKVKKST